MRRARVRVALIVVVLGVLGGIGFLIGRTMVAQRRADEQTSAQARDPSVSQSIRHFHRVKVEEGRTVWDLRAEKADFLDAGRVVVDVPELAFFADDGQSVSLSGARGEVTLNGPDVDRIDLKGGIEVEVGQYRLETPEASWVGSMNSVIAPAGVDLRGGGVALTGKVMIVELATRRVLVLGDVRTVLSPGAAKAADGGASREEPPKEPEAPSSDADPEPEVPHAS